MFSDLVGIFLNLLCIYSISPSGRPAGFSSYLYGFLSLVSVLTLVHICISLSLSGRSSV